MRWKAVALVVFVYIPIATFLDFPKIWLWHLAGIPAWGWVLGALLADEALRRYQFSRAIMRAFGQEEVPEHMQNHLCGYVWELQARLDYLEDNGRPPDRAWYEEFKKRRDAQRAGGK